MDNDASRVVVVKEWSGKYQINEFYRPIAKKLVEKFPELIHVQPKGILFLDNTQGKKEHRGKKVLAQISMFPEKWNQIIYQLTGRAYLYMIEFFKENLQEASREQIIAVVYHELKHIGKDGELVAHDIEDWDVMYHKLGHDWTAKNRDIPDLLGYGVDWDNILQPSLFQAVSDLNKFDSRLEISTTLREPEIGG